jgi:hypothetical protein
MTSLPGRPGSPPSDHAAGVEQLSRWLAEAQPFRTTPPPPPPPASPAPALTDLTAAALPALAGPPAADGPEVASSGALTDALAAEANGTTFTVRSADGTIIKSELDLAADVDAIASDPMW